MEDILISNYLILHDNMSLAPQRVSERFSMETILPNYIPLGTHKPWLYIHESFHEIITLKVLMQGSEGTLTKWLLMKGKNELFPLIQKIAKNSKKRNLVKKHRVYAPKVTHKGKMIG